MLDGRSDRAGDLSAVSELADYTGVSRFALT